MAFEVNAKKLDPAFNHVFSKPITASTAYAQGIAPAIYDIWQSENKDALHIKLNSTAKLLVNNQCDKAFLNNLPLEKIYHGIYQLALETAIQSFVLDVTLSTEAFQDALTQKKCHQLIVIYNNLRQAGLGGDAGVRAFAKAIDELIVTFVRQLETKWADAKTNVHLLKTWIERCLHPFVKACVDSLTADREMVIALDEEMELWQKTALTWLGVLRIARLWEFVLMWPRSSGAIADIKAYIVTPEARKYLTTSFHKDIERRLLHAGATTKQILDVYMLIIPTFMVLDSGGVLLERVSLPIRKYLRSRSDTVPIIISSMLADVKAPSTEKSSEISMAIAQEMTKPIATSIKGAKFDMDLDFDNMEYLPQPIDAGPDHRRNEHKTTVAHLLDLYDKDHFIAGLQPILGEHLLKCTDNVHLERETRLLEIFKLNFGEDRLQACEVMLNDITKSRRINKRIMNSQNFSSIATQLSIPKSIMTTQILSSFFWPEMRDDEFTMPAAIQRFQSAYEDEFEEDNNMMKLQWLPSLGRATVELHFQDRTVVENVPPWVATVIYAFDGNTTTPMSKTIAQLAEELSMDELLLKNALTFWISKQVLTISAPDTYTVLESLPSSAPIQVEAPVEEQVSAVKTAEDKLDEMANVYQNFIYGMLMAHGSMPVPRIHMMLKIAVPGGFDFGEKEARSLLKAMIDDGRLTENGDSYSVVK